MLPCKLQLQSSLPLDLTQLREGVHTVTVRAFDATGQSGESPPFAITVQNPPTNSELPVLSGRAVAGEQLTASAGKWAGAPAALAYQWLRCPPSARPVLSAMRRSISSVNAP
jgi:hypothetical protein